MGSSPSFFFILIPFLLPNPLFTSSPESDTASLLLFKSSISDPSNLLSSWTPHTHHCSWAGVSCHSPSNRVSSLNITGPPPPTASQSFSSDTRLLGNLPLSIAALSQLTTLSLPSNAFSGPIPSQLFNLHLLHLLDLSRNRLVGLLPTPLTPLPYLETLNLGFNNIHGEIPFWLSHSKGLRLLNLAGNQINGTLPSFVTAMDELRGLYLSFNQLHGPLPSAIGTHCSNLRYLDLSANFFTKGIPTGVGNCTELRVLLMSSNLLDGAIPTTLGDLHNLEVLDLSGNTLGGAIPPHLGNCSLLTALVLSSNPCPSSRIPCEDEYNYFSGGLPDEITSLSRLRLLWAERLTLYGDLPKNWTSCSSLQVLNLAHNFFRGEIPQQLQGCHRLLFLNLSSNELTGTMSSSLAVPCMSVFDVSGNRLFGSIPEFEPCHHASLGFEIDPYLSHFLPGGTEAQMVHDFSRNNFSGALGSLPGFTGKDTVYYFSAQSNTLSFVFPGNLFNKCDTVFRGGLVINLRNNMITGLILEDTSSICGGLKALDVSSNRISGSIPAAVGELSGLLHLNFSFNRLSGGIPASIGGLQLLRSLSLSENNLSGVIPSSMGGLRSLTVLELSSNSISGEIPVGFAGLRNITILLLDNNRLTEKVPAGLMNLPALISLNLSFNNLSGPLPVGENLSCAVIAGNPLLGPCRLLSLIQAPPGISNGDGSSSSLGRIQARDGNIGLTISHTEIAAVVFASIIFGVFLTLLVIWVVYTTRRYKTKKKSSSSMKQVIMFTDIGFPLTFDHVVEATGSFSSGNCIGNGGFGATYKAEVHPGVLVAVKRLGIGRFQGAQQFHAEIKALGSVKHENLVTLIGYHASETEMFLILNYLPGGNLEKFIKERSMKGGVVEWQVLHKIAMDVAKALAHLHDQCTPRVLHRDVKPSNILLDDHHNAYLSDFGLARLMGAAETHATTGVAGTFGYVAPEYAMTCRVSDKADVYSYGVVLLELLSDKKALDPSFSSFGNGFNIVAWASLLLSQGRACEFFAAGLWERGSHRREMVQVLHLALFCTVESLPNRLTMRQVVWRLNQLQPLPARPPFSALN